MKTALMAAAFALTATFAAAATITIDKPVTPINATLAQQDVLAPTAVTGGFFQNVVGSIGGVRRSPFDTIPALAGSGKYNSVQSGGTATYAFGSAQDEFSLLWGSPDRYNTLSFFLGDDQIDLGAFAGVSGMSVNGAEIAALPLSQPERVGLATVLFSGFLFDKVVFASSGNAFEYAMVSSSPAPVPLPAAAWLLFAAIGGLAAVGRRRAAA